jgi:cytochrome oxidase Cu insertion factor (SCO1/SenC/PrrC family)
MKNIRPVIRGIFLSLLLLIAVTGAAEGEEEMLQAGQPFVAFELAAHDGSTVDSADLEGRPFLLFFYPKASTPG